VTKYAAAVRLPDAVAVTVLPSECNDPAALTHLENVDPPVPDAVIDIESPEAIGITLLSVIVYVVPLIVTATEPVPFRFAVSVRTPLTNTAVATRSPDAVTDTVPLSECRSPVALIHLENVYPPVPDAVIDISSPEAAGIFVLAVIVYTAPLIVTATEPVPLRFAVNELPPSAKNTVATGFPDTIIDTVLSSECSAAVELTHLENMYPPVPFAVIETESLEAADITVSDVIVYVTPFIVTSTEPVPSMFTVNVDVPGTNTAVAERSVNAVADTSLPSECRDGISLIHLENALPAAVIDISSLNVRGITVPGVTVYVESSTYALLIVTSTEPVPVMLTVNVNVPVTNTAVAVRLSDAAVADTVPLSEFRSAVPLIHLENTYPEVPDAVIDIVSPEATGISVV